MVSTSELTLQRLSLTEMALISATTWGFGFLQYCFEQENVFYNEFCRNETKDWFPPSGKTTHFHRRERSFYSDEINLKIDEDPYVCEDAKSHYNLIFTLFQVISTLSKGSKYYDLANTYTNTYIRVHNTYIRIYVYKTKC